MEAWAEEILYEIGHRIRMHLMMWWRGGQKMKGLCKEDNGDGRWETRAFWWLPLVNLWFKKKCCCIGKTKHPHTCSLPLLPFTHTWLNSCPLTSGFQHTSITLALFLSCFESQSTLAVLEWNEAWKLGILFQHTGVYYTVNNNLLHTHWEGRHVQLQVSLSWWF